LAVTRQTKTLGAQVFRGVGSATHENKAQNSTRGRTGLWGSPGIVFILKHRARVRAEPRPPPLRATPQISDRVPGIGTHHQGWPRPALPPPRTTPSLRPPRQNGPSPFGWRPNVHPTPPGSANSRREATPASPTRPSRRAPTASRNHLLPTAKKLVRGYCSF
jgi:hypothetical protein